MYFFFISSDQIHKCRPSNYQYLKCKSSLWFSLMKGTEPILKPSKWNNTHTSVQWYFCFPLRPIFSGTLCTSSLRFLYMKALLLGYTCLLPNILVQLHVYLTFNVYTAFITVQLYFLSTKVKIYLLCVFRVDSRICDMISCLRRYDYNLH